MGRRRTIGALAKELGVGVETIRFYERQGLISQPLKTEGPRHYDDGVVTMLHYAKLAGRAVDGKLPLDGIPFFPKWAESAFVNPDLDTWLQERDVKTLALTGLKANACISSTAKEALRRGYRVQILADAVACGSDRSRARALAQLAGKGVTLLYDARASHSGMLSCFFQGFSSFLLRSIASTRESRLRVACGMITSSI
jgi:DNA-binding transcriptional MerR regulator